MRHAIGITALAAAMAASVTPAPAWSIGGFVDWVKKAKGKIKNADCWKNPFDNKCV